MLVYLSPKSLILWEISCFMSNSVANRGGYKCCLLDWTDLGDHNLICTSGFALNPQLVHLSAVESNSEPHHCLCLAVSEYQYQGLLPGFYPRNFVLGGKLEGGHATCPLLCIRHTGDTYSHQKIAISY